MPSVEPISESETESVDLKVRRRRLRLCTQMGSPPSQLVDEAEGIIERAAEDTDPGEDLLFVPMARAMAFGLQSLDVVDLVQVFELKARVMRSIPKFMRGVFRGAMKVGLFETTKGRAANNLHVESRGWKLFMLLPRLLLFRPPRGGLVPKGGLKKRVQKFCAGEWISLFEASMDGALAGQSAQAKCQKDTKERRTARALALAQMGELSSARQALEGAAIAPGDEKTWKVLSNEAKRPKRQRCPLDEGVLLLVPSDPLALVDLLLKTLRSAKKGSAGGSSGMTVEHLRPLLESGVCSTLLEEVATQFARGQVPEEVLPAVRLGKMTALQKPDGGVRGIVEMCFGGWSLGLSPSNSPSKHKERHIPSSTHSPPGQAQSVSPTWCRPSPVGSKCHHPVHRWCWGLRFHLKKGNVSWPHGHGGRREAGSFRETLLQQPFDIHLGRRCR